MSAGALKILLVDDEPPIRKLLRMGLTSQGYQVLDAPNGKTALELLAKEPDLVILDLGLPDVDGLDLLRRIRHRNVSLTSRLCCCCPRPRSLTSSTAWPPSRVGFGTRRFSARCATPPARPSFIGRLPKDRWYRASSRSTSKRRRPCGSPVRHHWFREP